MIRYLLLLTQCIAFVALIISEPVLTAILALSVLVAAMWEGVDA